MSLRDFQRALTAMTLDAALANAVHATGAAALADYLLTPRESRRLAAVVRQPGMALNCTLARANRFGAIHNAFAMTCVLLGRELREVLDALWSGRPPANYQLSGEEAPFAEAVEARIAAGLAGNEYLGEVLAYERACLELATASAPCARPAVAACPKAAGSSSTMTRGNCSTHSKNRSCRHPGFRHAVTACE